MDERIECLMAIYNQHWEHARHVENERMWFGSVFGAVVAGTLALAQDEVFEKAGVPLLLFLILLSLFGIIFSIRLHTLFKGYVLASYRICRKLGISRDLYEPAYVEGHIRRVSIWRLFAGFYLLCLVSFIALLLRAALSSTWFALACSFIMLSGGIWWLWKLNLTFEATTEPGMQRTDGTSIAQAPGEERAMKTEVS